MQQRAMLPVFQYDNDHLLPKDDRFPESVLILGMLRRRSTRDDGENWFLFSEGWRRRCIGGATPLDKPVANQSESVPLTDIKDNSGEQLKNIYRDRKRLKN